MSVVLITGASSGIGLATASAFADSGARVFAGVRASSDRTALMDAARRPGRSITPVIIDVADDDSVATAIEWVLRMEGKIDVLVNNAGIGGSGAAVERIDFDLLRAVFETTVFGALRTMRAVLPSMRARKQGTIVNVSSLAARVPRPFIGVTSATKQALEALTEILALEVAPFGIRAVLIEPGPFRTGIIDRSVEPDPSSPYLTWERAYSERQRAVIAAARPPDEVARVIVEAVNDFGPRLRYPVGEIAIAAIERRESLSWDDWYASILADYGLAQEPRDGSG